MRRIRRPVVAICRQRARGAASALAIGVVLALAACAAEPEALPAGVTVTLQQLRSDVAERTAQVRVANGSDDDLRVARLELRDDWFDGVVVRERDSTVEAGRTVDLRIELPPSACDGEPDAADRETVVTLTAVDGTEYRVRPEDPLGFLGPLHERECLAADVAAIADLSWGAFTPAPAAPAAPPPPPAPPPPASPTTPTTPAPATPATLRLDLLPAGGSGTLRVVEVRPTNLLQFAVGSSDPLPVGVDVTGTGDAASVDVPLVPLRCDAHAVQEDKRGTVFTVAVETGTAGDGAAGLIEVAADEAMRGRILAWVAEVCGFG